MIMILYYVIVLFVLWGLALGIMAIPLRVVRVNPTYSSWVDCASLIGDI